MSRNTVYRGAAEACFEHFKRQFERRYPKGAKGVEKAKRPLADFCGVGTPTVTSWFTRGVLPKGEVFHKLICFLQVQGYKVNELRGLDTLPLGLLELIGYSVVGIDEVNACIGYPNQSQLLQRLKGQGKLVNGRAERGWELLKKNRATLNSKKEEIYKNPPYGFGASIGAPLQHRGLLGCMEALLFMLQAEIPPHEAHDLRTRLGELPTDLCEQIQAFMEKLQTE